MYRFIRSSETEAQVVYTSCFDCGKPFRLSDMWVDINGPAFKAFYCHLCAVEKKEKEFVIGEGPDICYECGQFIDSDPAIIDAEIDEKGHSTCGECMRARLASEGPSSCPGDVAARDSL